MNKAFWAGALTAIMLVPVGLSQADAPESEGPLGVDMVDGACIIGMEVSIDPTMTATAATAGGALVAIGEDPASYRVEPVDANTVVMSHLTGTGTTDEAYRVRNVGSSVQPAWVVVATEEIDSCAFDPNVVAPQTGPPGTAQPGAARTDTQGQLPANIGGETASGY